MNAIQFLSAQPWVERLGWTLVYFLWQGALIAATYAVARRCLRQSPSAQIRYVLACAALAAMVVAPVVTFTLTSTHESAPNNPYLATVPVSTTATGGGNTSPVSLLVFATSEWHDDVMPWLVAAWFAGAIIFWMRLAGGWIVAARIRSTSVRPAPAQWQQSLDEIRVRIRVSRPVRLLVSALVQVPTVIGWLRPVVLVPVGALAGLPPDCVEALLAHELAHIRRHDYLVNILQSVAEALLFYHPAVWWISNHIRNERELCCDDIAVSISGDPLTYARALTDLESYRPAHLNPALAANGGSLADRIARLLGQSRNPSPVLPGPEVLVGVVFILSMAYVLFGQAAPAKPEFEVASIRPSAPFTPGPGVGRTMSMQGGPGTKDPGRVIFENFPLPSLILVAFDIETDQFFGPDWLTKLSYGPYSAKFDITAKIPDGTSKERFHLMLQNLLAERFKVAVHRESKELPIYNLVVAKSGPKFKLSLNTPALPNDAEPGVFSKVTMGKDGFPVLPPGVTVAGSDGRVRMRATKETMEKFVIDLTARSGRQVRDLTGLKGEYDFELYWVSDADASAGPTLTEAVQDQLGLRLQPANGPVDILVVDHAEKTPTEN